jgi:heme-degrading monooxygenase HmoA
MDSLGWESDGQDGKGEFKIVRERRDQDDEERVVVCVWE